MARSLWPMLTGHNDFCACVLLVLYLVLIFIGERKNMKLFGGTELGRSSERKKIMIKIYCMEFTKNK